MMTNDKPEPQQQQRQRVSHMLTFKEFMEEKGGDVRSSSNSRKKLSATVAESAPKMSNSRNLSNPLPVMLTFQRQQMVRFSDGKIVAVYKELRTGLEIVFPSMFSG